MVEFPERSWRCPQCGMLLGVEREGRIHLKYKAAQYMVEGKVAAVCHRCHELCVTTTMGPTLDQDARSPRP